MCVGGGGNSYLFAMWPSSAFWRHAGRTRERHLNATAGLLAGNIGDTTNADSIRSRRGDPDRAVAAVVCRRRRSAPLSAAAAIAARVSSKTRRHNVSVTICNTRSRSSRPERPPTVSRGPSTGTADALCTPRPSSINRFPIIL